MVSQHKHDKGRLTQGRRCHCVPKYKHQFAVKGAGTFLVLTADEAPQHLPDLAQQDTPGAQLYTTNLPGQPL